MLGLENWTLARPEIFLAAASALLLLYGVLRGEASATFVSYASAVALLVTASMPSSASSMIASSLLSTT